MYRCWSNLICSPHTHTHRQRQRQTDRDTHTSGLAYGQACRETRDHLLCESQRETDRQTDRQTETETETETKTRTRRESDLIWESTRLRQRQRQRQTDRTTERHAYRGRRRDLCDMGVDAAEALLHRRVQLQRQRCHLLLAQT
eukprot:3317093-Rhodomonas_salina.1